MLVRSCDNIKEIRVAKAALNTNCYGVIVMQDIDDYELITRALEFASGYMDDDIAKEKLYSIWKVLL